MEGRGLRVNSGGTVFGQMLYARWKKLAEEREGDIAFWHPQCPEGMTFGQLAQLADDVEVTGDWLVARSGSIDFLPLLLAGWRERKPVILVEGERAPREVRGDIPEGTCVVKQTCGAAGIERSLFFSEEAVLAEAERNVNGLGLHSGRRGVAALSLAHSYGFGCLALPLLVFGIPVEEVEAPFAALVESALTRGGPVFLPAVPALWKLWWMSGVLKAREIDLAVSAGAPLSAALELGIFREAGLKVHNFYGTSETGAIAFDGSPLLRGDSAFLGRELEGVSTSVGEEGRLIVRTDGMAFGSDSMAEMIEWQTATYVTADRVEQREEGLFFLACEGAAINVAGRKVSPTKIEKCLGSIKSVRSVTITPKTSRDPERVQEIVCDVVLELGAVLSEVKVTAAEILESWEMPRVWRVGE